MQFYRHLKKEQLEMEVIMLTNLSFLKALLRISHGWKGGYCHPFTLGFRCLQLLRFEISCHLRGMQLSLRMGRLNKNQRFSKTWQTSMEKRHITSGSSDHFSRNRSCHGPRLVYFFMVLAMFWNMCIIYLYMRIYAYVLNIKCQFNTSSLISTYLQRLFAGMITIDKL